MKAGMEALLRERDRTLLPALCEEANEMKAVESARPDTVFVGTGGFLVYAQEVR